MESFTQIFIKAPGTAFSYYPHMIGLVILLFASALAFSAYYKKKRREDNIFKRLFRKTVFTLNTFAVIFILLLAMRYENIPYFSMRLWLYVALIALLYQGYKHWNLFYKVYPKEREHSNIIKEISAKKKTHESKYTAKKKRR